ncbi:MAG: hypothetical protein EYC70_01050 [Planctomycetota bacterium]|nr:MAG: hypothetical protein EYC70_01050 [Planctomycetota bacterium]
MTPLARLARLALAPVLAAAATAALAAVPAAGGHPRFLADAAGPPDYSSCYACHEDIETNAGDGTVSLSGVPAEYVPGQTYRLTVNLQDPGSLVWAFELVATDDDDAQMGNFTIIDPRTEMGFSSGRQYPRSAQDTNGTFAGTPDGPVSWQVDWTAPPAGRGTAYFYMAALAGNLDHADTGDFTYTLGDMAAERNASHEPVGLLMQPDDPDLVAGEPLIVQARVKNFTTASRTVFFVSRAALPNGDFFPATGWLQSPIAVGLAPGELRTVTLPHLVPDRVPNMTIDYQGFLAMAGPSLVDDEAIPINLLR